MSDSGLPRITYRDKLAFYITGVSVLGVIAAAQTVLAAVLPLLGSWVGTILAYYFSKENFEAATSSLERLSSRLASLDRAGSVRDRMIRLPDLLHKRLPRDKDLRLSSLLAELGEHRRVPTLSDDGRPNCVIHRSLIDEYRAEHASQTAPSKPLADLTVADVRDTKEDLLDQSFVTVREDGTLRQAKAAMERQSFCQDVFVTSDGTRNGNVVGWLTNVILQNAADIA